MASNPFELSLLPCPRRFRAHAEHLALALPPTYNPRTTIPHRRTPMPDRDPLVQRFVDEAQIRQLTVEYGLGTDAIGRNDRRTGITHYRKAFTDDAEIQV